MVLKNAQARRKAGQKLVLNARPDVQDEEDDASTNDVLKEKGAVARERARAREHGGIELINGLAITRSELVSEARLYL